MDEPEVKCVDCTLSDSDPFSNEQAQASSVTAAPYAVSELSEVWNRAVGAPQLLAEAHDSQPQADTSATQPFFMSYSSSYYPVLGRPSTSFPLLPTFPSIYPESTPTLAATLMPSAFKTPQPSKLCGTSVDDTSRCSPVSRGSSSGSHSLVSQSTSSYAYHPTSSSSSSASVYPPSGNLPSGSAVVDAAYTTVSPTYPILVTSTTLPLPLSSTVTSTSIVMVSSSSSLPQPSSVLDTTSNSQLPLTMGAIIGGTVGAVVLLLALLTFIVLRHRRTRKTPFNNLLLTTGPTQVELRAGLKTKSASGAVRPSSGSSSFIQYSEDYFGEYSWNISPPCATDHISSHLADAEISASGVAGCYRSHEPEKLYPYPFCVPASDQHHHYSVES